MYLARAAKLYRLRADAPRRPQHLECQIDDDGVFPFSERSQPVISDSLMHMPLTCCTSYSLQNKCSMKLIWLCNCSCNQSLCCTATCHTMASIVFTQTGPVRTRPKNWRHRPQGGNMTSLLPESLSTHELHPPRHLSSRPDECR